MTEAFESLIQMMQKGENDLELKERGYSVRYGQPKATGTTIKKRKTFEKYENDGRAPDTTKHLSKALKTSKKDTEKSGLIVPQRRRKSTYV